MGLASNIEFQGHHPSQGEGLGLLQIKYYVPRICAEQDCEASTGCAAEGIL